MVQYSLWLIFILYFGFYLCTFLGTHFFCDIIYIYRAPFWGGSGEKPQKISGDKIAFAAQQIYTKIRYRCSVV